MQPPPTSARVDRVPEAEEATVRSQRDRAGPLAALAAMALFGSLFLDWYRYPSQGGGPGTVDVTGWQVLSATDLLLAALAAIVVLAAVVGALRAGTPPARYIAGLVLGLAGIAAVVLVVVRLAFPPGSPTVLGVIGVTIDATRLGGVFVATAASLVLAAAGVVAASGVVLDLTSRAFERLSQDT